jgi:hypothetical protein
MDYKMKEFKKAPLNLEGLNKEQRSRRLKYLKVRNNEKHWKEQQEVSRIKTGYYDDEKIIWRKELKERQADLLAKKIARNLLIPVKNKKTKKFRRKRNTKEKLKESFINFNVLKIRQELILKKKQSIINRRNKAK